MIRAVVVVAAMLLDRDAFADEPCADKLNGPDFGERFQIGKPVETMPALPHPNSRFIRARLQLKRDAPGTWHLIIRDGFGRPIQVIDRETMSLNPEPWTVRVPGEKMVFDLIGGAPRPQIQILEYMAMPAGSSNTFYSIVNEGSKPEPLYAPGRPVHLGDAVGLWIASRPGTTASTGWCCSGFAVTESLFITNWHCGAKGVQPKDAWKGGLCPAGLIDFSWDGDDRASDYGCVEVLATSRDLDYAVLKMARLPGALSIRPVRLRGTKPRAGESLRIVQHPACQTKQISSACMVRATDIDGLEGSAGVRFFHDCGTRPGSSGAPVFDADGLVVGLHHDGQKRDADCQEIDQVNRAISAAAILEHLRADEKTRHLATEIEGYSFATE